MDKRLNFYFYRLAKIEQAGEDVVSIHDTLEAGFSIEPTSLRKRRVGSKDLRLERYEKEGGLIFGDVVRLQTENIPSKFDDDGLKPLDLSDGEGIAHAGSFCINEPGKLLILQYNRNAFSANSLLDYIKALDVNAQWWPNPIIREDAWSRFERGQPKRYTYKIAGPVHAGSVDAEAYEGMSGDTARTKRALEAPYLEVSYSVGRRKGWLNKSNLIAHIKKMLGQKEAGELDLEKLTVAVSDEDGRKDVSFFDELKKETIEIDGLSSDPQENYRSRKSALKDIYYEHGSSYLEKN